MCGDLPQIPFQCVSPEVRINKDIKEFSQRLGIDLEMFRDFMFRKPDYAIIHFGTTVVFEDLTTFDGCITDHRIACLIKMGIQPEFKFVPYEKMMIYVNMAYTRREKDELREKLRSVGIDPVW